MLWTVIVKGSYEEACQAIDNHGLKYHISLCAWRENDSQALVVHANDIDLAIWFCELPREAPFPAGTLLFYTLYTEDD